MLIRYPPNLKRSEQGYTIMESLVAIVVVTIILVSTAQTLALVVATRVQNRRAEQAQALAQQEVDRIRVLVEQGGFAETDLPALSSASSLEEVPAPTALFNQQRSAHNTCNTYQGGQVPVNQVLRVDSEVDSENPNDCETDFLIQTFRVNEQVIRADSLPEGFEMGVRVYSARAEQNLGSLGTEAASLQMTTGTGRQTTNPLGLIYTKIVRNDQNHSLCLLNPILCISPPEPPEEEPTP